MAGSFERSGSRVDCVIRKADRKSAFSNLPVGMSFRSQRSA
jgi:hypothetical protein